MVIVLGLPTLGLNLSCSPGPVRVDEGSYANPSQIPCFNLIIQIFCLNLIFINRIIIIPYLPSHLKSKSLKNPMPQFNFSIVRLNLIFIK